VRTEAKEQGGPHQVVSGRSVEGPHARLVFNYDLSTPRSVAVVSNKYEGRLEIKARLRIALAQVIHHTVQN
jgi:hypothetical protein